MTHATHRLTMQGCSNVLFPGGGGAHGYLGGCIRSLSKLKNTPKDLISGQKSILILIKH